MALGKTFKDLRAWEVAAQAVKPSGEEWPSPKGTQEAFDKAQRLPEHPPAGMACAHKNLKEVGTRAGEADCALPILMVVPTPKDSH